MEMNRLGDVWRGAGSRKCNRAPGTKTKCRRAWRAETLRLHSNQGKWTQERRSASTETGPDWPITHSTTLPVTAPGYRLQQHGLAHPSSTASSEEVFALLNDVSCNRQQAKLKETTSDFDWLNTNASSSGILLRKLRHRLEIPNDSS